MIIDILKLNFIINVKASFLLHCTLPPHQRVQLYSIQCTALLKKSLCSCAGISLISTSTMRFPLYILLFKVCEVVAYRNAFFFFSFLLLNFHQYYFNIIQYSFFQLLSTLLFTFSLV